MIKHFNFKYYGFAIILILIFACSFLFAGEIKKSDSPSSKQKDKKPDEIRMTADKLTYDEQKKIVRLINNVRIMYKDAIMTSERAEFNGITKIGHFTGGVKLWQPGNVITADWMDVFYTEKKGILYGHVRAIMEMNDNEKKKDDKKGDKAENKENRKEGNNIEKQEPDNDGPVIMTCEEIEFFWEKQEGTARKNVKVWRREKTAYADTVNYTGSAALITMSGHVRFERSNNDWMICPEAYYDLKTKTFVARGGVEGNMEIKKEEKKEKKASLEEDRILYPSLNILEEDVFVKEIPADYKVKKEERIIKINK